MKVLAIIGSSKNGNTTETVKYFERALSKQKDIELEYLYLSDHPLEFCTGCHNCIFIGEDKCPHYQKVKVIEDKMLASDALILASPGYMFSITAIMKNLLDHVAYNCHRPKYFGKKIFLIASCTKWLEKSVFGPMETWGTSAGFKLIGKVYIDLIPMPLSEKELEKRKLKLDKAAKNFYEELNKKEELKPDFGGTIIFHVFKTLCKLAPNILKADFEYFRQKKAYDKNTKWYVPAKVSTFNRFMAQRIEKKMEKEIRNMIDLEKLSKANSSFRNKLL